MGIAYQGMGGHGIGCKGIGCKGVGYKGSVSRFMREFLPGIRRAGVKGLTISEHSDEIMALVKLTCADSGDSSEDYGSRVKNRFGKTGSRGRNECPRRLQP